MFLALLKSPCIVQNQNEIKLICISNNFSASVIFYSMLPPCDYKYDLLAYNRVSKLFKCDLYCSVRTLSGKTPSVLT